MVGEVFEGVSALLTIQGVALGSSRSEIESRLGKPLRANMLYWRRSANKENQEEPTDIPAKSWLSFYGSYPLVGAYYGQRRLFSTKRSQRAVFLEGTQLEREGKPILWIGTKKEHCIEKLGEPTEIFANSPDYLAIPSPPPTFYSEDWVGLWYEIFFTTKEDSQSTEKQNSEKVSIHLCPFFDLSDNFVGVTLGLEGESELAGL